ncbi:XrtA system polysaccharide deacetylase [Limnoglobus roseus]|uniref:Putative beta/alpha-barrel-type carbohydrate esterase n=1 Tax=Limnoglobus roseus TaxID=2598579 RepID=A0A5C1AGW6_9BACT|nr:XrtA system polysaccharide deacetylase [Limnoglobus roseus]QEL17226.1 putative beta/alpha-barrel-type carbohydrate esterase [Limnoglobus roseus]
MNSLRTPQPAGPSYVLSFDVEEHHRIEAAAAVECSSKQMAIYAERMEDRTRMILDLLAAAGVKATFYIVGQIAETHPKLVRDIADAGHEVGSHSYDHRRVHRFTPEQFADDVRVSKDRLEQTTGQPVYGFRAPTFSIVRQTAWAVDVLAEVGIVYDSSIFPVRHDRYGIPDAPRTPFLAFGRTREILELPPATYRVLGQNLPVAGGGYFRLFPPIVMRAGLSQLRRKTSPAVGMLYFHPWEFDPDQPKLPLKWLSKWRTYVGISKSTAQLERLVKRYSFRRAIDVVNDLLADRDSLPRFAVG